MKIEPKVFNSIEVETEMGTIFKLTDCKELGLKVLKLDLSDIEIRDPDSSVEEIEFVHHSFMVYLK